MGGLGNQLFQYATGRAVAERCGARLWLDLTYFAAAGGTAERSFELGAFRIDARVAPRVLVRWTRLWSRDRWRVVRARLPWISPLRRVVERPIQFTPDALAARGHVYLDGFWQSARYFEPIRPLLLAELEPRAAPDADTARLVARTRACESVAVHVRRGDYVTAPGANAFHGVLDAAYYAAAADLVRRRVRAPVFFVFSDDPRWAAANLRFGEPTVFVSGDARGAHQDLRIMRHCRHQIIANSTFSWWGAWLNRHPAKIVVAPARWFRAPDLDAAYMIPEGWIRL